MEIDEYVETSDVEEMEEERHRLRQRELSLERHSRSFESSLLDSSPQRKRIKVFHEQVDSFTIESLDKLSVSPAKSLGQSHQFRSSPTALNPSPRWPSVSSRSPSLTPFEDMTQQRSGSLSPALKSHDTLLLHSPSLFSTSPFATPTRSPLSSLPLNEICTPESTISTRHPLTPLPKTPPFSPPGHQRELTAALNHTPSLLAYRTLDTEPQSPHATTTFHNDDALLLFTPTKLPTVPLSPASPLTPIQSRHPSPITNYYSPLKNGGPVSQEIREPTPLGFPSSPVQPVIKQLSPQQESPSPLLAPQLQLLQEENVYIPEESRYSFRKRKVAQLKPFTFEYAQYQHTLRSKPEAILKMKALERLNHRHSGNHYEADGETQQDLYLDEDAEDDPEEARWAEAERRRMAAQQEKERRRGERASLSTSINKESTVFPEILRDLSDSDDEAMDGLTKEAKKAARRKLREEREKLKGKQREKDDKTRNPRRFPRPHGSPSSRSRDRDGDHNEDVEMINDDGANAGPSRLSPLQNDGDRALHDYFEDYEYGGSESESEGRAGPSNFRKTPRSDLDKDNDDNQDIDFNGLFDDDMGMQQDEWGEGPNGIELENLRESSPVVSEIARGINLGGDEADQSGHNDNNKKLGLDLSDRKIRWLRKMMPVIMIKNLIKEDVQHSKGKNKEQKVRPVGLNDEEDLGPLRPGQTRVRKTANPKDIREIKGDSESESEIDIEAYRNSTPAPALKAKIVPRYKYHESDSDDAAEILKTYRPETVQPEQNVEGEVQEVFTSESEFDDEDIDGVFFPKETDEKLIYERRLLNEGLIDYMLTKCRIIGGARKAPSRRKIKPPDAVRRKPSGYKVDITTAGARGMGRGYQTTLSFGDAPVAKKPTKRQGHTLASRSSSTLSIDDHSRNSGPPVAGPSHHRASTSSRADSNLAVSSKHTHKPSHKPDRDIDEDQRNVLNPLADLPDKRKMSYKEKEKERKQRAKQNGIFINNNNGAHIITSGARRDPTTLTVELEDAFQLERTFQLALAPKNHTQAQREHWSEQCKPKVLPSRQRIQRDPRGEIQGEAIAAITKAKKSKDASLDMGVRILPSGQSFGAKTNIGRGWLFELVNVASGMQEPAQCPSVTLCGYTLEPDIEIEAFCEMLPQITDSFFEYVTALPDLDENILDNQWSTLAHVVSQYVSSFLVTVNDQKKTTLRVAVEKQVSQILERVQELTVKDVDVPTMTVVWFAVELSVRLTSPHKADHIMVLPKASTTVLITLLLQFGLRKVTKSILKGSNLDGSKPSHFAAQLWISLIHIFSVYLPKDAGAKLTTHPFWSVLLDVLRARAHKQDLPPWHASEDAWFSIFSLCALSQFSMHGTTIGQPRLTAHWDAVIFCLKHITLEASPDEMATDPLQRRDKYVSIVVKRCMLLYERWGWKLHNALGIFNELAAIFRSRKFANLYHEFNDFPDFLKIADASLLSTSSSGDTAYMTFLKLIIYAAREDPVYVARKSSPKVKKWLSMAVPVGAVPLPKEMRKEEIQHFLSMYYNRLAAVAVAVEIDPSEYTDRTEKARHYIDFATADQTTRFAIFRAIMYWCIMGISHNVKVHAVGVGVWLNDISTILRNEFFLSERMGQAEKGRVLLCITFLITSVRKIIEAHMTYKIYPEPSLIVALKPILFPWKFEGEEKALEQLQTAFAALGIKLFEARDLVSARPSRLPPYVAPNEESQESQDFGMDDFGDLDWDHIDLPPELAGKGADTVAPDAIANDYALCEALEKVQFRTSLVITFLRPRLQAPLDQDFKKRHEDDCDKWLRLFLCCSSLQSKADKWPECIRRLEFLLPGANGKLDMVDPWINRVRLSLMYQLLQLDPMAYVVTEGHAVEVFVLALVSDHVALEKEYVAHFLSVVGLRYSLFHSVENLPVIQNQAGDVEFSVEKYLEIRMILLKGIFKKVDETIQKELGGDQPAMIAITEYLELVQMMFSTMRDRLKSLMENAQKRQLPEHDQKRDSYRNFCHEVYLIFKDCPHAFIHQRLEAWCKWGRGLTNNI